MRPLVAPLSPQRPPPSWPLFVLIEDPLMAILPSFLRVEVVLRTPRASRRGGRTQPSCCSPPAGLGAPFVDEDHSEVVVRDLARVAHQEVGGDQAFGPREQAIASLDLTYYSAVPEVGIWACHEPPEPDAAKAHAVPVAELDRACVVEHRLLAEGELCLEGRVATRNVFERAVDSGRT